VRGFDRRGVHVNRGGFGISLAEKAPIALVVEGSRSRERGADPRGRRRGRRRRRRIRIGFSGRREDGGRRGERSETRRKPSTREAPGRAPRAGPIGA